MVVWGHDLVPARTLVASARTASSEFEQFADEYLPGRFHPYQNLAFT